MTNGSKGESFVTIPASEYESLCEDSNILRALAAAGVDNWDGYSYAMEILEEED